MAGEINFEIHEHIAVLETHESGWRREVNLVSWNGGEPKIDIREWSTDHERMTRGITLTEEKAEKLANILSERYGQKLAQSRTTPKREEL